MHFTGWEPATSTTFTVHTFPSVIRHTDSSVCLRRYEQEHRRRPDLRWSMEIRNPKLDSGCLWVSVVRVSMAQYKKVREAVEVLGQDRSHELANMHKEVVNVIVARCVWEAASCIRILANILTESALNMMADTSPEKQRRSRSWLKLRTRLHSKAGLNERCVLTHRLIHCCC